mmetsp:Transcript_27082/g.42860  ORF Transcript_27082/g.42860 Transcript_27082/m.42860 type:complete len:173 (-) Transcript_27082:154-672(-)|eukprot:CAMPEP_0197028420 /NCGR_PEP_ID=MMETSP1384-20130603/8113_1 /TAXON_ID=29189 /ORGANISM="Ammonia sp." /LENGTH=172 /DNA_ID=CAMNT_0042457425 /DNA_START=87 /DNA_END=605 /DNA_ORIENTATION=+
MPESGRLPISHYTTRLAAWFAHLAVCLSATIIAFTKSCDTEQHRQDMVLEPHTYLAVGGIVGIIEAAIAARWVFNIAAMTEAYGVAHCCGLTFDLAWAIVGSTLFFQLSWPCEHSAVGSMIFAYVVTKWIYAGFRCLFLVSGFSESEYEQRASLLIQSVNAKDDEYGTMPQV